MEEQTKKHKEEKSYVVRIGKLLREVLDMQKKQIEKATYNCVEPSDFEAGEIVAKKILGEI